MKSLNTVQRIARFLKVIYTIGFILSIIGFVGAVAFAIVIAIAQSADPNYVSAQGIALADIAPAGIETMILIAVASLGEIICQFKGRSFYKFELKAGTPFDAEVVKKCKSLGWTYIVVAIIVNIAALIYVLLMGLQSSIIIGSGLFVGIGYLIVTAVLRYGSDVLENKQ